MRTWPPILLSLLFFGCTSSDVTSIESAAAIADAPASDSIEIKTTSVPLNPNDPTQTSVGAFTYAGGIELTGVDTTQLHGLSDLRVWPDNRLLVISDDGAWLEGRLVLGADGHLVGISDARLIPLLDQSGQTLRKKSETDAEGLAVFPNGDRLVSFERDDRIWLYSREEGAARRDVPKPDVQFPNNRGMEALSVYPAGGADAYLVASEDGRLWLCHVSEPCREAPPRQLPGDGFGLAGMASYGKRAVALLYRAYDAKQGVRVSLRLIDDPMSPDGRVVDELTIAAPLTRDNFEGVAAVPSPDGTVIRFYLIADDNSSDIQHTYLQAFDWKRLGAD